MDELVPVQLAVEDELSEVVLRTVLTQSGRDYRVGTCFRQRGFGYLKKTISGFNNAAKGTPFIVLTDLDAAECAPALAKDWLAVPKHHNLIFRVAVKKLESWILADRLAFADFLRIKMEVVPGTPDKLGDPKAVLIELARKSRRTSLREAIAPNPGSTAKIGPDYNATLGRFVQSHWDVKAAMAASPSLRKAFRAVLDFKPKLPKNGPVHEGE